MAHECLEMMLINVSDYVGGVFCYQCDLSHTHTHYISKITKMFLFIGVSFRVATRNIILFSRTALICKSTHTHKCVAIKTCAPIHMHTHTQKHCDLCISSFILWALVYTQCIGNV